MGTLGMATVLVLVSLPRKSNYEGVIAFSFRRQSCFSASCRFLTFGNSTWKTTDFLMSDNLVVQGWLSGYPDLTLVVGIAGLK